LYLLVDFIGCGIFVEVISALLAVLISAFAIPVGKFWRPSGYSKIDAGVVSARRSTMQSAVVNAFSDVATEVPLTPVRIYFRIADRFKLDIPAANAPGFR
jgi:hypothetical protein